MKPIQPETISDQLAILQVRYPSYNDKYLANKLDVSPQTISSRKHTGGWYLDEIRALKRIFNHLGYELKQ